MTRELRAQFLKYVDQGNSSGCWEWRGATYQNGYGRFYRAGKHFRAHRVSYEIHVGPIPDGKILLHSCDNRVCVNPAHLRPGTHADNMLDAISRGRMRWQTHPHERRNYKRAPQHKPYGKLTSEAVQAIRSGGSPGELAKRYGVSVSSVHKVRQGRIWAHVQ